MSRWSASATTGSPVSIRTICPGLLPRRPLPSEAHPRVVFETPLRRRRQRPRTAVPRSGSAPACIDWVKPKTSRGCATNLAPTINRTKHRATISTTVREVERRIQKGRSPKPADHVAPRPRPPRRRARGLRRPRAAHVRPPSARDAGRRHARAHLPARPRNLQPHLQRNRRARAAPSAHPPRRQPGEDREGLEDQRLPRLAVRLLPREAGLYARGRRQPARTTRSSSTAAAWATPTSTTT